MTAASLFAQVARRAARRPRATLLVVLALALAGGALATGLAPTAATDTLVGRSDPTYQATQRYHRLFGDDAVIVLIRGQLSRLVLTQDLERVLGLEGCLSGNLPPRVAPPGGPKGPCAALARTHPVQVVYGPGTFINESVRQITDQLTQQTRAQSAKAQQAAQATYRLARARGRSPAQARRLAGQAQQLVIAEYTRNVLQLALRYGITSVPRINDPDFVSELVFDATKPVGTPKARFAYLFPNRDSALIQVRLRPGLSDARRAASIAQIRRAVAMPEWHLQNGAGYVVTGVPVVVSDLTKSITDSVLVLLAAVAVVMALTLAVAFRSRLPLLPLGVALCAAAFVFGGLALLGAPLTMATIAVLPILIGLGVDYAIQFQSRVAEARSGPPAERVARAISLGAPTIAAAGAATAGGLLALLISPVPMVRGFALLLVVGMALAFACTLTAGAAAMARWGVAGGGGAGSPGAGGGALARALGAGGGPLARASGAAAGALASGRETLGAAWRGAGELLVDNRPGRALRGAVAAGLGRGRGLGRACLAQAHRQPARVLAVGLALAALGWALDTQTPVQSDIQKLVPQNLGALRDLRALERSTGVGGEIDVTVSAPDMTNPAVVRWMTAFETGLLQHYHYSPKRGCGQAQLCPAFSLTDLFSSQGSTLRQSDIRALFDAVPRYFSQGVVTADRRVATLAFGIRLMPLDEQERVIELMRSRLHPPPGVHAELAGVPVLAADANGAVASPWRRLLTLLVGLAAVTLVLLAAMRRAARVVVPLVPVALATGWSALMLFVLRIPLNPMSVTLGALVIAIGTEFSVLLSERYRQERAAGWDPRAALERTYRSTGSAVLASGATAIAGFAVLVFSDIRMLRDFGAVTLVDLTVSLAGVMVVLPSVLILAERGELGQLPARALRALASRRPRLRRARTA
jgi:predicted RND superfamily exporter protein